MSSSPFSCGICDIRHISKPSEVWCPDCEEGLCTECVEHNSLAKPSRNHTTIPISEYRKLPSYVLEINELCKNTTKSSFNTAKNMSARVAEFAYWKITKTVRR